MSELVTDHMEAALPLPQRLRVRLHLALCSSCRAFFDQMAKTARLLRESPPPETDVATHEHILRRLTQPEGGADQA